ncbi:hypothetical protein [Sphingobium yanoikuyae]|jgi:hypothetical protein|uniref:Uncharacterized protein n=1 Tax=Sphingobium yanoikuyae TaxID=13690 RepID=A0A6M4GF47_SPHYA|nr:hypothetical protein [Sphingobium yanoikuyae]QJR05658.1 hypothetical protein HH800_25635 [Sphingobium yanoikuyae]RSU70327.1 hypothetical protein BRX37_22990 [Sphingomonas sp. S-NIH.Pt3_0716]
MPNTRFSNLNDTAKSIEAKTLRRKFDDLVETGSFDIHRYSDTDLTLWRAGIEALDWHQSTQHPIIRMRTQCVDRTLEIWRFTYHEVQAIHRTEIIGLPVFSEERRSGAPKSLRLWPQHRHPSKMNARLLP